MITGRGLFLGAATMLLIVTVPCLAGCAYKPVRGDEANTTEATTDVVYKNISLVVWVSVLEVNTERVNGLLHVRVKLKNNSWWERKSRIRFKFLDANGWEIEDSWGWEPHFMESGEIVTIERTALTPAAADFKLFVENMEQ